MKNKDTLVLAHYYVDQEVQALADIVGDSLELAMKAVELKPKRIVFAGVRFMAETVKVMLPDTEVILPHRDSTCSLVTQTNIESLKQWRNHWRDRVHIMYINSSAEMKATADWIVTSRNVDDIVKFEIDRGNKVIFSPDYNMGQYLNYQYGYDLKVYNSVCEVHDLFKEDEITKVLNVWTDGPKFLLAHPESPLPVLKKADVVGSTNKMLNWVKDYPHNPDTRAQIYVATEEGLLHNMRSLRDDIDIYQAPTYNGCQCNACPYMKKNTIELVQETIAGNAGVKIELTDDVIAKARKPIERMLEFSK